MAAGTFNVVGAFRDDTIAERAVASLRRSGLGRRLKIVRRGASDPARVAELQAEMQEEVTEGFAGPSIGFMTPDQAKGATVGTVLGATAGLLVGSAVGVAWALLTESAISTSGRIAIAAVCFLIGGATMGFIAGGALKPRFAGKERPGAMLDERRLVGEDATLVAIEVTDEHEARVAQRMLEETGASRVDAIDKEGSPMPPQLEHPRPADPPDWWSNGGRGRG